MTRPANDCPVFTAALSLISLDVARAEDAAGRLESRH